MPVTYANIPLEPPEDAVQAFHGYWHGNRIDELEFQGYLVPGVQHLATPYLPQREPPRIGVLSWPTGADRFAVCHLIATGDQVQAVRAAIGTNPTAQPLVFTDGTTSVTADMHAIIRPISQRANGKELYLLTLVDDRYFWPNSGDGKITSVSTWDQLFTDLFALIGVTADIDTVPAAYLDPNPARWLNGIQPVPILIEAAARQVGMRVVRLLDGTVSVQSYSTASAVDSARWTEISELVMAGGRLTGFDVGIISPSSVDVCFFDDTAENVSLISLSLADYGGSMGVAGKTARWTADPASLSSGEKTAYAQQAATDYYNWNLALTDVTLRSFQDVDPCGLDEVVEWVHHPSKLVTRIIRPQWSDRNIYGDLPTDESGSGSGCFDPVTPVCTRGVRKVTIRRFRTGTVDGRIQIVECDEHVENFGPCSPITPDGVIVTPVSKVCPIFETFSIQYLDWSAAPQTFTFRAVIGITTEKIEIVVPIADALGCVTDEECDNCGSGSGSGCGDCITACDQCVDMASLWRLQIPGLRTGNIIVDIDTELVYVCNPDDGNYCRFTSPDLVWDFRFDYETSLWALTYLPDPPDNRRIWYIDGAAFRCLSENTLFSFDGESDATITPQNCESGSGSGMGLPDCGTVPPLTLPTTLHFATIDPLSCGGCSFDMPIVNPSGICGRVWGAAGVCTHASALFHCMDCATSPGTYVLEFNVMGGCLPAGQLFHPIAGQASPFYLDFMVPECLLCGSGTSLTLKRVRVFA